MKSMNHIQEKRNENLPFFRHFYLTGGAFAPSCLIKIEKEVIA
jgi:hypothetical protein